MEGRTRKLEVQVLIAACAALALPAIAAAQADTVRGQLRVNGTVITLQHVYVSTQPGFFDRTTEDIRLLFTDVPLDEQQRLDPFVPGRLARQGKLHGLEVILDARGEPTSGSLFIRAFNGMASVSGMHRFEKKTLEHRAIAGRLFTDGPRTFSRVTWDYDLTFAAAIPRPPTAEETVAVLKSPPALAATAHLQAMRRDLDAFVATLTRESGATFRGADGQRRLDVLIRETPSDSKVVSLVRDDENTATATVQGHRGEVVIEFTLRLRLENGEWKVAY